MTGGVFCAAHVCAQFWQLHHVALPDAGNNPGSGNPHNCCLCFLCEVCSRWGPCEHMYACLQREGEINKGSLPEPKKAGRPRKDTRIAAAGQGAALVPGPMLERTTGSTAAASSARAPMPQSGAEDIRDILADAGLGHHFGAFARQKATRAVLADLTYADLHIIFGLTLAESHELKAALARSQSQSFAWPSSPVFSGLCESIVVSVCLPLWVTQVEEPHSSRSAQEVLGLLRV